MKLSNLFMIALLAGTLGVLGCDSDPATGNGGSGGSGTAGTGGTPDACTTGECADSSADVQTACGAVKDYCNSDSCCTLPGAGGAGGSMMIDPEPDVCDAAGQAVCEVAGAGGTGGTGGTGGSGATCDYTGDQICANCDSSDLAPECRDAFATCLNNPPSGNFCEKCAVVALAECGVL